jgi:bile acid-coenzyme A ligase
VVASAFKAAASGGSTGRPKIILSGSAAEIPTVDGDPVPQFAIGPGSVALFPGPLYHNTALTGTLMGLSLGAHVVLEETFDPELTLALIEKHRVTMALVVPTHMQRISRLDETVRDRYDLSSLKVLMHNAAACPPELKRQWIDWLGPERIVENYTSTEQAAVASCNGVEWLAHPGTVGRVVQGEMRILDDEGRPVPPGTVGAIWMRRVQGAPPTYRYVGADSHEQADGWDTVGDLGWMDEDGYLYLADRRTDMIISGGANIYPAEVEGELAAHPEVLDCVVVGLPDEDLGKRVHAIVHTDSATLDHQALATFLETRLVRYKTPRSYEFVSAPLRDDAGKVRRSALAEQSAKERSS